MALASSIKKNNTPNFAQVERKALVRTLREVGPAHPTLCEGWNSRDLAVHLVERDSRPDVIIGVSTTSIPFLSSHARTKHEEFQTMPWEKLTNLILNPPKFSSVAFGKLDRAVNTAEFFIHHEDIRRAADEWEPRELSAQQEYELFKALKRMALPLLAKRTNHVVLLCPGFGATSGGKRQNSTVTIVNGKPSEVFMWAFGRERVANVEITEN